MRLFIIGMMCLLAAGCCMVPAKSAAKPTAVRSVELTGARARVQAAKQHWQSDPTNARKRALYDQAVAECMEKTR